MRSDRPSVLNHFATRRGLAWVGTSASVGPAATGADGESRSGKGAGTAVGEGEGVGPAPSADISLATTEGAGGEAVVATGARTPGAGVAVGGCTGEGGVFFRKNENIGREFLPGGKCLKNFLENVHSKNLLHYLRGYVKNCR